MRMEFVIQRCKVTTPPPYTEVERKYTEVAACGTPFYFRENLSENLGTPMKTCKFLGLQ